jgi:hypothetical protein
LIDFSKSITLSASHTVFKVYLLTLLNIKLNFSLVIMKSFFYSESQSLVAFFGDTVLAFCYCDKIPKQINLKGGRVYFGLWFQRFQSMITWPCFLWLSGEAAPPGGGCSRGRRSSHACQEAKTCE